MGKQRKLWIFFFVYEVSIGKLHTCFLYCYSCDYFRWLDIHVIVLLVSLGHIVKWTSMNVILTHVCSVFSMVAQI